MDRDKMPNHAKIDRPGFLDQAKWAGVEMTTINKMSLIN